MGAPGKLHLIVSGKRAMNAAGKVVFCDASGACPTCGPAVPCTPYQRLVSASTYQGHAYFPITLATWNAADIKTGNICASTWQVLFTGDVAHQAEAEANADAEATGRVGDTCTASWDSGVGEAKVTTTQSTFFDGGWGWIFRIYDRFELRLGCIDDGDSYVPPHEVC